MRIFDWIVVVGAGVVGWLLVSWLFSRTRPQEPPEHRPLPAAQREPEASPDAPMLRLPAPEAASTSSELSLDEIGRGWYTILGVPSDATAAEIERAYHSKLADCDRMRFSPDASAELKRLSEEQRSRVNQAFEFIRPLRQ